MQKLFLAVVIIFFGGLICKKGLSQTNSLVDSTTIERMLAELDQLKESNLGSAFELSKAIQRKADKINYQNGVWEARIKQGIIYNQLGQPDSSLAIISQVLRESQDQNNRLVEIKAHIGLSTTFQQSSDFHSSVNHLIQAEKLLQNKDSFNLRFDILNKLGIVHRSMKDNTNSMKYFNILESTYLDQLSQKQRFFLFLNKGNVFADQKEYDKTEEWFKKAYEEIKKVDSPANKALITYNLGALFYRQKRYAEAKESITKSLAANLEIGEKINTERCYRVLGAIYDDQKDYSRAINYYNMALEIARSIKNSQSIMGNYNNLYIAHWNSGFYRNNIASMDKALSYYQKYNQIKDSLYKIETTAKVLEFETKYETEKKNNQITLLEKENQHQEDQIRIQHAQRNYLFLIIILVSGILAIFIYFFYYYKKVNKLLKIQRKRILTQKNKISEQNSKLQKSINTQNKLFSIIAHDLRSPLASIFNISSLIGFYIEDENYGALENTVEMMNQKTDQILELTDNLLSWARSQMESLQPLFIALSINEIFNECLELYRPIARDKNITIEYLEQPDLLIWADRNMVKTICRNLINNAVKFTHKNGLIKVRYEANVQFVRISIRDSGIGMDKARLDSLFEIGHEKNARGTSGEKSTGLGLSVCKEFIDALNGKIWVESEEGVGSEFTVELLLYNPEVHPAKHKLGQKPIIPAHLSN
ncbi:MAG: tetratricopeptide repeat-containing sensor histidine kinase [Prolixibacteraceae bacterium]|jgi:signal transduction histidine kinase